MNLELLDINVYVKYFSDPLESPEISRKLSMGDTMLNSGQEDSFIRSLDMSGASMGSERRIFYWPKGVIPYHIDCSLSMFYF